MGNDIRTAALAALLGSLGAAFAHQAQQPPPKEPSPRDEPADRLNQPSTEKRLPDFSQLDANGDGSLTEEEVRNHVDLAALFSELDSDNNGRISMREYAQAKVKLEK